MRVVASGQYRGRVVEVAWSDKEPLDGPRDAILAIIRRSAQVTGTEVQDPDGDEVLTFDYLRRLYGFKFLARQVLGSRREPAVFETDETSTVHE